MNGGGLRSKRWFAPFDLALRRCVVADGMFGDVECLGDVAIFHALCHQRVTWRARRVSKSAALLLVSLGLKLERAPSRNSICALFAQICPLWTQRMHLASDSNPPDRLVRLFRPAEFLCE